jgi:predicted RNA-binding Zn ribbon-like protein
MRVHSHGGRPLGVHVGVDPAPAVLDAAAAVTRQLPILAGVAGPELAPATSLAPPEAALARLAIAWVQLRITGQAVRLKRCAEHTCELVFWDESKNRSRRWCSMRVCGSRVKSRRYAARMAASASTTPDA